MRSFLKDISPLRYVQFSFYIKDISFFKNRLKGDFWVLSRCACLGNDVYVKLPLTTNRFNIQKGRADYLTKAIANPSIRPKPGFVLKFLNRKDVLPFLFQQRKTYLLKSESTPSLIYMDSYSELTDQLFRNKLENWDFCLNYTDVQVDNSELWKYFECVGLLSIEDIKRHYDEFFSVLRNRYPEPPIIFIHFPTKLDNREKFKIRSQVISQAIKEIKHKFQPFYEFGIDESLVEHHPQDSFPYHFSDKTYLNFANQIIQSGVLNTIKK